MPEEHRPIGKYGRMHREYLREVCPARLHTLTLTGELWTYLADLNEQAQKRLDTIMELLFELLREAGIRLPSQLGNTICVVGGLIVGQAAVEAGIVSTIVVIVVALTAIASFAIPNEAFASLFRLLKFLTILAAAFFGIAKEAIAVNATTITTIVLKSLLPLQPVQRSDHQQHRSYFPADSADGFLPPAAIQKQLHDQNL